MSTNGPAHAVAAIEIDMRDVLRTKKKQDYRMEAKRPVIATLLWSLKYQVNRFMRSIISLMAFKGCGRS